MKILLEEKVLGTQSKKNSKYYWILETITGKNEVAEKSEDEDYLMTSSGNRICSKRKGRNY